MFCRVVSYTYEVYTQTRAKHDSPLCLHVFRAGLPLFDSMVSCYIQMERDALVSLFHWSRIGRAESSDGLNWRRTAGQMPLSSVLDKNTEQWWCFDTAHVGLGDVNLGASSKVVTESSVYFMYYFGGDYEETDVQAEFGLSNVRYNVGVSCRCCCPCWYCCSACGTGGRVWPALVHSRSAVKNG